MFYKTLIIYIYFFNSSKSPSSNLNHKTAQDVFFLDRKSTRLNSSHGH
jgi:hypothetical protein